MNKEEKKIKNSSGRKRVKVFRCEKCFSANTYITKKERVCRKCGFRKKLKLGKKK